LSTTGTGYVNVNVDTSNIEAAIKKIEEALAENERLNSAVDKLKTEQKQERQSKRNTNPLIDALTKENFEEKDSDVEGWHGSGAMIHRFVRMVPGAREVQRVSISSQQIADMNLTGFAGIAILAFNLAKKAIAAYEKYEAEQTRLRQEIKELRKITQAEYETWKNDMYRGKKESQMRPVR